MYSPPQSAESRIILDWKRKKKIPLSQVSHSCLLLTVCDLQQGFGNKTTSYVESLAAVEAAIRVLNVGNGQTARLGDREAAKWLRRLVREEETLERRREITDLDIHSLPSLSIVI